MKVQMSYGRVSGESYTTRQTVLGLYEDISTPGFSEVVVGSLKTVDVSVKMNTASRHIDNENEDDNGKFQT